MRQALTVLCSAAAPFLCARMPVIRGSNSRRTAEEQARAQHQRLRKEQLPRTSQGRSRKKRRRMREEEEEQT
eukprot:1947660-Rhodomonas_salina.1